MTPFLIEVYTIYAASFIAPGSVAFMLPRSADDLSIARHVRWMATVATAEDSGLAASAVSRYFLAGPATTMAGMFAACTFLAVNTTPPAARGHGCLGCLS